MFYMDIIQSILKGALSLSSDIVVIAALTAVFASVGLFFGKDRLVALILTFYPAGLIFTHFPYFSKYTQPKIYAFQNSLIALGIFLIIFIVVYFIIRNFVSSDFSFSSIKKVVEAGVLGLAASSLAILFSYNVVNLSKLYNFSSGIDRLFDGSALFWWLLAPFVILFIFKK